MLYLYATSFSLSRFSPRILGTRDPPWGRGGEDNTVLSQIMGFYFPGSYTLVSSINLEANSPSCPLQLLTNASVWLFFKNLSPWSLYHLTSYFHVFHSSLFFLLKISPQMSIASSSSSIHHWNGSFLFLLLASCPSPWASGSQSHTFYFMAR